MSVFDTFKRFFTSNGIQVVHHRSYDRINSAISLDSINSTSIYLNSIYARLSTDISKIKLQHVKTQLTEDDSIINEPQNNSSISYVLNVAPNKLTTPLTFWSEVSKEFLINKIALVLPEYKNGELQSLNLIREFTPIKNNSTNDLSFIINNKEFKYEDVLVFHDINYQLHSELQSIANLLNLALNALNLKLSSNNSQINGFLKYSTRVEDKEMLNKVKDRLNNIKEVSSGTGIGYLQEGESFQELNKTISVADDTHLEFLVKQLQENYGLNSNILSSSYSEEEYNAYMNSIIIPYQTMIVEELNKKLFSKTAMTQGNKVISIINMFDFATLDDFAAAAQKFKYIGVMSSNEIRHVLGLPSYAGGDRYETNANAVPVVASNEEQSLQNYSEGGD